MQIRVGYQHIFENKICFESKEKTFFAVCLPTILGVYVSINLDSDEGIMQSLQICAFDIYGNPQAYEGCKIKYAFNFFIENIAYSKMALTASGLATMIVDGVLSLSNCYKISSYPYIYQINLLKLYEVYSFNVLFDFVDSTIDNYVGYYPHYFNNILCLSIQPEPKKSFYRNCKKPLNGKFFTLISQRESGEISLCEIQIFGIIKTYNLALKTPKVGQSYTDMNAKADLAVDGISYYKYSNYWTTYALSYYVEHYIKTRNIRSQNDNNSNARDIKIDRYMLCTATRK
ncbi:unnamed protein product [Gordionus sp. m RMFG-2023]